jgi:hypothetical protein
MNRLMGMQTAAAISVFTVMLACGSNSPSLFSSGDDGGAGGGASGSGSGGSSSGSGGSATGSGGSSGTSGGGSGAGFAGARDAAAADAQAACVSGSTQSCCSGGTETCNAAGEIGVPAWGPCLNASGAVVTCAPNYTCGPGENAKYCDAGVEAGPPPPPPPVCTDPTVSTEPECLVGYFPAMGQTVGMTGQIKVWVNDENSPFIAPMEQVDNTTGAITTPGMRTATAADGLLYEPALYIAPQTPTNGGTPHFPQLIKGSYNNNPPTRGTFTGGAPIDTPPASSNLNARYTGEFVWDVSALGLAPGSYTAVFSVHDGDHDRAIACVTIVIAGA